MTRYRIVLAALLLAALAMAAPFHVAQGRPLAQAQPEHAPPAAPAASATPQHEAAPAKHEAAAHEGAEAAHDPGWWPTIWKTANFLLLVGALTYFLRAPVMGYLQGRIGKVREDLVTAKQTREAAVRQLSEIDAKLAALPAELEALKVRGAEDLVAERARIEQEAQAERQRVLEHTRREIEMRLRVAKRELLELGATLAVNVASERIKTSITLADQVRLVDRYAAQLQAGAEPGRGKVRQ
jgi:F-type H+-transporting ATPase subunit b